MFISVHPNCVNTTKLPQMNWTKIYHQLSSNTYSPFALKEMKVNIYLTIRYVQGANFFYEVIYFLTCLFQKNVIEHLNSMYLLEGILGST